MSTSTMARSTYYQIRISPEDKEQVFSVFRDMGISPAQAVKLFFKQVVETRSIPFPIQAPAPHCPLGLSHVPNAKTIAAMKELDNRENLKSYVTVDDLLADLND